VTCMEASDSGHLEILTYAQENGCPYNHDQRCIKDAGNGHLEFLESAHEKSFQYAQDKGIIHTQDRATQNGYQLAASRPWPMAILLLVLATLVVASSATQLSGESAVAWCSEL
jgi:hypothetical protein